MGAMHADELAIDAALVARLLATQFPRWAELPFERVEPSGTDNAIYRLGADMAVRLPRQRSSGDIPAEEFRWLPRLAPYLPLAIPEPIALGEPAEGYPCQWLICRWLEGENATHERITDPSQAAMDLAGFISALQAVDPTGGPAPEWSGRPVWIHGDLDARNMLVQHGRLSGVLDFATMAVGDPASDVMVAWKMLPAAYRDTFRVALAVDDATWARARGWVLSQALMVLSYYTMETNPTLVVESRRWMREVLADG